MTQVLGKPAFEGSGADQLLGEFESAGLSLGWNRATLTADARAALCQILERGGGAPDRFFELRHGLLVLLRCRMIGAASPMQLSFDGSQRRPRPETSCARGTAHVPIPLYRGTDRSR